MSSYDGRHLCFNLTCYKGIFVNNSFLKNIFSKRYFVVTLMSLFLQFLLLPVAFAENDYNVERAERYFLSMEEQEGQEYRFDLFEKEGNKFIIILQGKSDGKTYVTPETVFLDNSQMENSFNISMASKMVIHATPVDSSYSDDMENCGIKCKTGFRKFLRQIAVKVDSVNLKYSGLHTFTGVRKKYERQSEVVLRNQEIYSNSHMLKDTDTGDLIVPDDEKGCYRNLDLDTGKSTGEPIAPCF